MSKEAIAIKALEALARLGNGDQYGNSTGNVIARTALFEMAEQPAQQEPKLVLTKTPDGFVQHAGWDELPVWTKVYYPQPPAQTLTPEWYARWIRNNYQDHPNIATLCDEMTKAAHGITKGNT